MALVIDNRATTAGQDGIHVLIVGVSDYLNLPDHDEPPVEATWYLNKLTSAALSAFKTYQWIQQLQLKLPLKTVRLLLSPSPAELTAEPGLATVGATRANRAEFSKAALDWRDDSKSNPADMTIFYFAGHGIQRGPEEGVLLLEDFLAAGPPLAKSFEIGDIRNGMAPSPAFSNIALTQFYFIDACLTRPEAQKKFVNPQVPDVFGAELNLTDRREAPMLFSTVDGAIALGRDGKPSYFAEGLMLALERAAEDRDNTGSWPITSLTIKNALDLYYGKHNLGTKVKMGGVVGTPVIRYLPGPPEVEISIEVQPDSLGNPFDVWLFDENDAATSQCNPAANSAAAKQFETKVKAGMYRVQIGSTRLQSSPYRSQLQWVTQRGPWPWLHNLTSFMKSTP